LGRKKVNTLSRTRGSFLPHWPVCSMTCDANSNVNTE